MKFLGECQVFCRETSEIVIFLAEKNLKKIMTGKKWLKKQFTSGSQFYEFRP